MSFAPPDINNHNSGTKASLIVQPEEGIKKIGSSSKIFHTTYIKRCLLFSVKEKIFHKRRNAQKKKQDD